MTLKEELFAPCKEEVWQKLSEELNGKFYYGNYAQPAKVEVKFKKWTITLDTNLWGSVPRPELLSEATRLRAPFRNKDNFQMTISSKSFFSSIGKMFGGQDINVGFPEFDEAFIIKGNDSNKVQLLFSNPKIREFLLKTKKSIHFEIKDQEELFVGTQLPEGVNELFFKVEDIIIDIEQLKMWFELFSEVLNHLCHMDSAYEDDPTIVLY